jgi:hypothetical protein
MHMQGVRRGICLGSDEWRQDQTNTHTWKKKDKGYILGFRFSNLDLGLKRGRNSENQFDFRGTAWENNNKKGENENILQKNE